MFDRRKASPLLPSLLPALLFTCAVNAQLQLATLPILARERAERSRPVQEKALEPFWADLALSYLDNQPFLDRRITEAAALGDSVVPLLLEKLQPAQVSDKARNLSGNCRRVLERLDPASFTDALVELANGNNEVARSEAIRLLGFANTPQSVMLLSDLLDRTAGEDKRLVLRSLRLLKAAGPAAKIVPMLGSSDRQVREDVLAYLVAARPSSVVDAVVQAMGAEKENRLLPDYVSYFFAAARENDAAARALLPLLDRDRLDYQEQIRLAEALATIAPRGHEPTCRKMHEILDTGDTTSLAVKAAVTLRTLGDRSGVSKLEHTLDAQILKRKKESMLYEQRANLFMAIDRHAEAIDDFQRIIEYTDGLAMTRRAYLGLIKCEAHRRKIDNLTKVMRASGMLVAEIEAIGLEDPAVQEMLQHDRVRKELQKLAKEQAPK
jgi:tetratricopeptide (TPR) repeat protein